MLTAIHRKTSKNKDVLRQQNALDIEANTFITYCQDQISRIFQEQFGYPLFTPPPTAGRLIGRLTASRMTSNHNGRSALNAYAIPIIGPKDGWPRTKNGVLVRPGTEVEVYNSRNVIRSVYDGGDYGYCVEIENADGPQGWAALRDCEA